MKKYFILLIGFCIACNNNDENHKKEQFTLQLGDLLFQDLDSSPLCDAIELVTPGYKGGNFSHIGIVVETNQPPLPANPNEVCEEKYFYSIEQDVKVLESLPGGVKTTRLDSFINRSFDQNNNPKVIVGRLKAEYRYKIQDAIAFLKKQIGEEYDNAFLINNNSYYCSELIYEAFIKDSIFLLQPMNFLHPNSKDTIDTWKKYYSEIGIPIPQNQMGINPGIMSLSNKIEIVHIYGHPDGMKK
tara:strand:- start:9961 stop:10689 length:729 start_codon:yes stop_codon:yes gene_type:complete